METLYPGQYLQEIASQAPVEGVSTTTGAFAGTAIKGAVGTPQLVTSWNDFVDNYGTYMNNSYLAYAVRGFFENGGTRAYISRVVHYTADVKTSAPATVTIKSGTDNLLLVDAKSDGTYGNNIEVELKGYDATKKSVTVNVYYKGTLVESFAKIAIASIEELVQSKYIKVTLVGADTLPVTEGKTKLAGGNDGLTGLAGTDYVKALSAFDNVAINILAVPGATDVSVIAGAQAYVEARGGVFYVSEVPLGKTVQGALDFKTTEANIASEHVSMHYPWVKIADPIGVGKNPVKLLPPSGHVAGVYARTDNDRGVFKAPAGIEANLRGIIGLEKNVSDAEQALLNPEGLNVIRSFPGEGIVVWGTRTTKGSGDFKYVPARRTHDYIAQSILSSTRWSVFEPNNETLWEKLTSTCEEFLRGLWQAGGLKGAEEAEAFFVTCDASNNTADTVDAGQTFVDIGVAHQKPSEFVVFRLAVRS